jgi:tol-pal system protein YbgF
MRQSRPFLASMALALVLTILTTALNPALAVDPAVEARLSRLERMLNERSLSELLLQLQQLQQEVQELRGQVETQQYLLRQAGIGESSFESQAPAASALSFDPSVDGGVDEPAFVLPGQAALTSERERVRPVDPGLLGLPAPETSSGGEREQYREAFEQLKARDYAAARSAFSDMVERYPQGPFADNGRYWLGEIGYVTQDYPAAQRAFSQLITDYPQSPKVPAAMLKLGYVSYEQGEFDAARRVLEEVVRRFPETTEARLAQGRLDRMQREQP